MPADPANSPPTQRLAPPLTQRHSPPPTRWESSVVGERWDVYVDRFAREYAEGADLEGEARFVDVIAPRRARVLDAGCGTGRIAAALLRMGHRAIGADRDAGLVAIAADRYPGPVFLVADLLSLSPEIVVAAGGPDTFDVVVLAGNVMVYLAPGTERQVLDVLRGLLVPGGRIVLGFATGREYRVADLDRDATAIGLTWEHRFATWHLDPWFDEADWAVTVFRRP
ncbi:MAG: class I SAM-dependent methyltransferase [Nakamurella sp.]